MIPRELAEDSRLDNLVSDTRKGRSLAHANAALALMNAALILTKELVVLGQGSWLMGASAALVFANAGLVCMNAALVLVSAAFAVAKEPACPCKALAVASLFEAGLRWVDLELIAGMGFSFPFLSPIIKISSLMNKSANYVEAIWRISGYKSTVITFVFSTKA